MSSYGPQAHVTICIELTRLFLDESIDTALFYPLTLKEFQEDVLVPAIAIHLIQSDYDNISYQEATDIWELSRDWGHFYSQGSSDEKGEEVPLKTKETGEVGITIVGDHGMWNIEMRDDGKETFILQDD